MTQIRQLVVGVFDVATVVMLGLCGFAVMTVLAIAPLYLLLLVAKGILAS